MHTLIGSGRGQNQIATIGSPRKTRKQLAKRDALLEQIKKFAGASTGKQTNKQTNLKPLRLWKYSYSRNRLAKEMHVGWESIFEFAT